MRRVIMSLKKDVCNLIRNEGHTPQSAINKLLCDVPEPAREIHLKQLECDPDVLKAQEDLKRSRDAFEEMERRFG